MKVLQVTAALEQGGVERGTVEMAAFIVAQGAQSYVASQGGRMVADLVGQGSRHIQLPLARRNPFAVLYSAFMLARLIRQEKIDLVHARSRAPAWAAYIATRMTKTKFITTFHGTHRIQNGFKRFYNSSMVRGERVIAISQFIKKHIMDNYAVPESRIDVAPRGFDPKIFDPRLVDQLKIQTLKRTIGLKNEVPVLSLPGRLTRWKGQTLFLEALARIKDLPWQAVIIGGPGKKIAYFEELKALGLQLGIAERVFFVGNQPDITSYYALSDIVVSASIEPEAFGRVAVEAQAMGKPVIVSAHGGSLETVIDDKTGWYFDNGNIVDLAEKIRIALGSENLNSIGERSRQWVMENFTIDRMCRAEWDGYLSVGK